jgi:arabinan endo-1,5-alpha-L-arabinosidase
MLLSAHGALGAATYALLLILVILTSTTTAQTLSNSSNFPLAHTTNHRARDPSIILYNNEYYLFQTSGGIEYYRASNLSGPWKPVGEVLNRRPSVIDKGDPFQPWAPTVIQYNNTFYCFYCVSTIDTRNSSIGVATSDSLEVGSWTDHGALINTVSGKYANVYPYNVSNALDPSVIVDGSQAYLAFGSYWTNLWQVPLSDDLLSVENAKKPDASHLSLNTNFTAEEGSWISYKAPYYYLYYSRGYCCGLKRNDLPTPGTE